MSGNIVLLVNLLCFVIFSCAKASKSIESLP